MANIQATIRALALDLSRRTDGQGQRPDVPQYGGTRFVTFFGAADHRTNRLTYVNAGQPSVCDAADGSVERLDKG
jgi:hypothetical protein